MQSCGNLHYLHFVSYPLMPRYGVFPPNNNTFLEVVIAIYLLHCVFVMSAIVSPPCNLEYSDEASQHLFLANEGYDVFDIPKHVIALGVLVVNKRRLVGAVHIVYVESPVLVSN